MKIGFAQINPTVGDIQGNGEKIVEVIKNYSSKCDLIIFPEMVLTGYPAQDLLFETQFLNIAQNQLEKISNVVEDCVIILGTVRSEKNNLLNKNSIFTDRPVQRLKIPKLFCF